MWRWCWRHENGYRTQSVEEDKTAAETIPVDEDSSSNEKIFGEIEVCQEQE